MSIMALITIICEASPHGNHQQQMTLDFLPIDSEREIVQRVCIFSTWFLTSAQTTLMSFVVKYSSETWAILVLPIIIFIIGETKWRYAEVLETRSTIEKSDYTKEKHLFQILYILSILSFSFNAFFFVIWYVITFYFYIYIYIYRNIVSFISWLLPSFSQLHAFIRIYSIGK